MLSVLKRQAELLEKELKDLRAQQRALLIKEQEHEARRAQVEELTATNERLAADLAAARKLLDAQAAASASAAAAVAAAAPAAPATPGRRPSRAQSARLMAAGSQAALTQLGGRAAGTSTRGKGKLKAGAGAGKGAGAGAAASTVEALLRAEVKRLAGVNVGLAAELESYKQQMRTALQRASAAEFEACTLKGEISLKDDRISIMEQVIAAAEKYEWQQRWECAACTFSNDPSAKVCEICRATKPSMS